MGRATMGGMAFTPGVSYRFAMAKRGDKNKGDEPAVEAASDTPGGEEEASDEAEPEVIDAEVLGDEDEPEVAEAVLDSLMAKDEAKEKAARSSTSLAKRDPLAAYMREAKRFPLLSREEEHELAVRWVENEDAVAARRLVESNLRLVVKIAYEYRRAHRNLLDLVQEGNVGLLKAVQKYDPYRGVKLSSYAAWWIRAYILKFILNNFRLVKIGTTQAQRKLFFNLKKERAKLEQAGYKPEPKLLAERLDVSEKDVVEMQKRLRAPDASLDAPVGGDDEGTPRTRMDFMESRPGDRPDVQAEASEFHRKLREKLDAFADTLEGREETIMRERWLTEEPLTLQQIGDQYGVSRERARQIEKRMLGRLRTYLEKELGTAVDIGSMSPD
ncbi:MAG: RNA polymerase factor sigma-32 [Deltaproteobacteria bacterium]|nr:RNA polymerase factor sigma-32 [Deltaproteobacteria bacterium]